MEGLFLEELDRDPACVNVVIDGNIFMLWYTLAQRVLVQ